MALEKLTSLERTAFLLHDIFDLSFDEIATALERTSVSCRQLASRARKRVHDDKPLVPMDQESFRLSEAHGEREEGD